ncbi:MAG: hypothetical protein HUU10_07500 [Bacteroidetes bacterium]|nr:hypothetical protein [Bacteroidota bacterium]
MTIFSGKSLFLFTFLFAICSNAHAQKPGWSAGALLGSPTGLSAKFADKSDLGFHTGLALTSGKNAQTQMFFGIEQHNDKWIDLRNDPLTAFYGVGAKLISGSGVSLGIRGSAGLQMQVPDLPMLVYIELAPVFYLVPATTIGFDAGVGIHYQF